MLQKTNNKMKLTKSSSRANINNCIIDLYTLIIKLMSSTQLKIQVNTVLILDNSHSVKLCIT
jgi:hypothetical protein